MNGRGEGIAIADILAEFLEVAIHMILFVRGIYPPEVFESTQKYHCPIKTARHPGLFEYIQKIAQSIRIELQKNSVERIAIVTLNGYGEAQDRFVFEMTTLQPFTKLPGTRPDSLLQTTTATSLSTSNTTYVPTMKEDNSDRTKVDIDEVPKMISKGKGKGRAVDEHPHYPEYLLEEDEPLRQKGHFNQPEDVQALISSSTPKDQGFFASLGAQRGITKRPTKRRKPDFGTLITMTPEIEALFRAVLLRIGTCHSYLAPVGQDSSFTVVLEMDGMRPSPEAKDFPWSPISEAVTSEQSKLSVSRQSLPRLQSKDLKEPTPKDLRAIIPVKNISIADLQLGLFIEKLVPSGDHQLQTPK